MGGGGPVPWTAMDTYARSIGLLPENDDEEVQYDDFIYYMEELDKTYLKYEYDKVKSESQQGKSSKPDWG